MAKIGLVLVIFISFLSADVQSSCMSCHKREQIPDNIIYKRYLLKYSSQKRIRKAIYDYLLNPDKRNSVMPKIFFTKFPMKKPIKSQDLNETILEYVELFDLKKRLVLDR
jgi:hypothetical protein